MFTNSRDKYCIIAGILSIIYGLIIIVNLFLIKSFAGDILTITIICFVLSGIIALLFLAIGALFLFFSNKLLITGSICATVFFQVVLIVLQQINLSSMNDYVFSPIIFNLIDILPIIALAGLMLMNMLNIFPTINKMWYIPVILAGLLLLYYAVVCFLTQNYQAFISIAVGTLIDSAVVFAIGRTIPILFSEEEEY